MLVVGSILIFLAWRSVQVACLLPVISRGEQLLILPVVCDERQLLKRPTTSNRSVRVYCTYESTIFKTYPTPPRSHTFQLRPGEQRCGGSWGKEVLLLKRRHREAKCSAHERVWGCQPMHPLQLWRVLQAVLAAVAAGNPIGQHTDLTYETGSRATHKPDHAALFCVRRKKQIRIEVGMSGGQAYEEWVFSLFLTSFDVAGCQPLGDGVNCLALCGHEAEPASLLCADAG